MTRVPIAVAPAKAPGNLLDDLLRYLVAEGASDIHLRTGSAPAVRINGKLRRFGDDRLTREHLELFIQQMVPPILLEKFYIHHDVDLAYGVDGLARFRVNAYYQRGAPGLIMRVIEERPVPKFEELGLPVVTCEALTSLERGLVLITGPTGSGKTTTLASMIDHINATNAVNIITLEDPVEVLHKDREAMVNQRELGQDTDSFAAGLRAALRQDPDVILIGEMRDKETVEAAISAAQTGHLVFSTLHTQDAMRTVTRIIDFFAPHERDQVRLALSEILAGIVSQRLLPGVGGGRVLAYEVMIATPTIRELVKDAERLDDIKQAMMEGKNHGMHTFDQHLTELIRTGLLTEEEALAAATSPHEVKIALMKG